VQFVEVATIAEADLGSLEGATAEVCLNDTCVSALAPAVPEKNSAEYGRISPNGIEPWIDLSFSRAAADGSVRIELSYQSNDPRWFADGDIYTVRLIRKAGAELLSRSWLATDHLTSMPNGPDCEPTCRQPQSLEPL